MLSIGCCRRGERTDQGIANQPGGRVAGLQEQANAVRQQLGFGRPERPGEEIDRRVGVRPGQIGIRVAGGGRDHRVDRRADRVVSEPKLGRQHGSRDPAGDRHRVQRVVLAAGQFLGGEAGRPLAKPGWVKPGDLRLHQRASAIVHLTIAKPGDVRAQPGQRPNLVARWRGRHQVAGVGQYRADIGVGANEFGRHAATVKQERVGVGRTGHRS